MSNIHQYFEHFIALLHQHPKLGLTTAFLASFLESLALIGTIIPGAVTMTAVGSMIGSGILPLGLTLYLVLAGALTGDLISYWLGYRFKNQLLKFWLFKRFPKIIITGEHFFHRHGGKSIIIGRFFGPVRSAIPLVAGMLKMGPFRFLFATLVAASLWSIAYTLPGILLGALALELPKGKATKFLLFVFAGILILWLVIWALKLSITHLINIGNRLIDKLWSFMLKHKGLKSLVELIRQRENPRDHLQLALLILGLVLLIVFFIILFNVMTNGWLTHFNHPVFYALQSFRNNTATDMAIIISLIGYKTVLFSSTLLLTAWLLWKGDNRLALHLFFTIFVGAASIWFFKHIIHNPRPPGLAVPINTYSFPSGHVTLSIIFYGMLAYFFTLNKRASRIGCYIGASTLIFLIALSRLYLGAHWLTDVIASLCLGGSILLLSILHCRRHMTAAPKLPSFFWAFAAALLLSLVLIGTAHFHTNKMSYQISWPHRRTHFNNWWQRPFNWAPIFRPNRFGKPIAPFNVQWAGSLESINKQLIAHDWIPFTQVYNLTTVLKRLGTTEPQYHMPLLPMLYQNKKAVAFFVKRVDGKHLLELRLWRSHLSFSDTHAPLWLGILTYHTAASHVLAIRRQARSRYEIDHAVERLVPDLRGLAIKKHTINHMSIPPSVSPLNWSGAIILIDSRKK